MVRYHLKNDARNEGHKGKIGLINDLAGPVFLSVINKQNDF